MYGTIVIIFMDGDAEDEIEEFTAAEHSKDYMEELARFKAGDLFFYRHDRERYRVLCVNEDAICGHLMIEVDGNPIRSQVQQAENRASL